jgi:hypothetical protein
MTKNTWNKVGIGKYEPGLERRQRWEQEAEEERREKG